MTTGRRIPLIAVALLCGLGVFLCPHAHAAEGGPPDLLPTVGSIERLDPRFDALVPQGAVIEVLASGFEWAEGPVGVKKEGHLLFSDIPRNRVNRWKQGQGVSVHLEPAGFTGVGAYGSERGSNGLTLDRQGCLISCEHGDRRVSRLTPGGGKRTVADNYQGKRFNSPNDCAIHSSGAIYFTDPPYGIVSDREGHRADSELGHCYVFRFDPASGFRDYVYGANPSYGYNYRYLNVQTLAGFAGPRPLSSFGGVSSTSLGAPAETVLFAESTMKDKSAPGLAGGPMARVTGAIGYSRIEPPHPVALNAPFGRTSGWVGAFPDAQSQGQLWGRFDEERVLVTWLDGHVKFTSIQSLKAEGTDEATVNRYWNGRGL
jgi:hypothetical protein